MDRHVGSHERRRSGNTSHVCTLCSLKLFQKSELKEHVGKQRMGEGTSAAQREKNNGMHLFNEPLLNSSKREKPDELIFHDPFSQLSAGHMAALISEENITALNNMCLQSFLGSHHSPPNVCSHASVNSISANENEEPLVSDLILLA